MLGVVAKLVDALEKDVVLESVLAIIPKFHDRNRQAFQLGFDHVD
jgi:hypothetical protein